MCNDTSRLSYRMYVLCFYTWRLKRNLEAGEIVSQVLTVQKALDATEERVSQIVIMGIGEPFENYDEMMDFLRIVNDDNSLNIGARHITVSTSGIIPRIYDFADEDIQINFCKLTRRKR